MDEANASIQKINGTMKIGNSILDQGEMIAYISMLADCDSEEVADADQTFTDFAAWLAKEKDVYNPKDVESRHPRV